MKIKSMAADTGHLEDTMKTYVSIISIEYKDGFYEVCELTTPISKHKSLQEAQWVRSVLESNSDSAA